MVTNYGIAIHSFDFNLIQKKNCRNFSWSNIDQQVSTYLIMRDIQKKLKDFSCFHLKFVILSELITIKFRQNNNFLMKT